jgi:hypothetical protein
MYIAVTLSMYMLDTFSEPKLFTNIVYGSALYEIAFAISMSNIIVTVTFILLSSQ